MKKPSISIVMAAYNSEKFIRKSIESMLGQTFSDFEFIIVDDCSKDKTLEIIREYAKIDKRIVILQNEKNLGVISSANKGLAVARARLIARMDSDDVSMPDRLEKEFEFLMANPDVGAVGTSMKLIKGRDETYDRTYPADDKTLRTNIFFFSPIANSTSLIRKEVFEKIGLYRIGYEKVEDLDFWFRVGTYYKLANLPEILLEYSIHLNQETSKHMRKMARKTFMVRWENRKNKAYRFTLTALLYNICAVLITFVLPGSMVLKLYDRLRSMKLF